MKITPFDRRKEKLMPFTDPAPSAAQGFTLIELLVVIAIIGLLASLSLHALSKAKTRAQGIWCLSNLRQMGVAYQMYLNDHDNRLAPNYPWDRPGTWVRGWMDLETSRFDNFDTAPLEESLLAPFINSIGVWKCPADKSVASAFGREYPRPRSISMNGWLNGSPDYFAFQWGSEYRNNKTLDDIRQPANKFVFLDEREDSINDGYFGVGMDGAQYLIDYPGSYHDGAGGFNFLDGHSEIHRWLDQRTKPALKRGQNLKLLVESPGNLDVDWLRQHTTDLK